MSASSSAPAAKKAPTWGGPPIIEVHEIKIISQIGSGCFGKVFRGVCRSVDVAVKVPNKQSFDPKQLQAFHHEVQIMSKIFAPNVCLFMGACLVPGNIRIVTELMEGDLERLLLDHSIELSLSVRMKMAKDAAQGMAWLHGNDPPVLHRDLKAANLLYDSTRRIKVCDFGLAETRPVGRELYDRQPKGTPLYMAPEVMEQKVITEKVDVYSFGIILWEIYTRKEAYTQFEDYDSFFQGVVKRQERPPIPADMPGPLVELTSRCWAHDPAVRPPFSEIVVELEKIRLAAEHRELEQVIESKLTDPRVCTMWKTQFLGQPVVRWPHFAAAFYTLIGLPPPTADEPVLTEDASLDQIQQASMEQLEAFGKISPECQSLVEDEKSRRRAASEKDVVVPAGYENSSGPAPAAAAEPSDYVFYQHSEESINAHAACLKSLVCLEKDVVDLSALERTLQCFGPASPEMLDRIYNLMKQPYFHGLLPTADADHMLCVESRGTFLVRFSNNRPRSICISKVSMPGMVRHMITTRIDDSWTFDDQRYPSVEALIEGIRATQNLETPYRTAPFAWIFKSK